MPCYKTITGWQAPAGGPLAFGNSPPKPSWKRLDVPCGQCIGCRLEHSRQWAVRCLLESKLHGENCFITLTYNDEHLPKDQSLDKSHLTKFFKRLRKARPGQKILYYACGEYGDLTRRAHYHACVFGTNFPDRQMFTKSGEVELYISQELNQLWGMGNTSIGELTFETAAYTARYCTKKKTGLARAPAYSVLDEETGEMVAVTQPYAVMSLRPAIAKQWLRQYASDIYNADKDFLVLRGKETKPPKYFDKLFDTIDHEKMERIKAKRIKERKPLTIEELRAHEKNTRARIIKKTKI